MSNYRFTKTNALLGNICAAIDGSDNENLEFPITLVVAGQLITGSIISEKAFYELPENELLSALYTPIREEKSKYFDESNLFKNPEITEEEISAIPDEIWQRFIYLKDARYLIGNIFVPSENSGGVAIQVRAVDISAFNVGQFSAVSNEKGS